ncbi:MAG: helix-turn-helix domain-containing protein [Prevotella sp.]|nr:helix-turn-helix domain-containing protein [Prevotella sp.]
MESIIVLKEDQLKDIVYEAVSRCFNEKYLDMNLQKPQPQGFFDRDGVCKFLHISYPTLWRMEKEGVVKSIKVGKKNLYDHEEIESLAAAGKLSKYSRK